MSQASQIDKANAFRAMHFGDAPLVLPNVWDAGSAVLAKAAGFAALATTSAGVANAYGLPDGEVMGRDQMLEAVARIAARVAVPVTADMEAGYGNTLEAIAETVRLTIETGAVGLNLEDGIDHAVGTMIALDEAIDRIKAARAVADKAGVPIVINGRTDVYFDRAMPEAERSAEAIRRANAYLKAGADCAYVIAVRDRDAIAALAPAVDGPLNIMAGAADLDIAGLAALGVKRISLAGGLGRVAYTALRDALVELKQGRLDFLGRTMPHPEINKLMAEQ